MKDEKRQTAFSIKEQGEILSRLLDFAKPYWKGFLLSFVGMVLVSGLAAFLPILIQRFMDNYLSPGRASLEISLKFALAYFALTLVKSAIIYVKDFLFLMASENTVANMRRQVYDKVVHLGMGYFDQVPVGTVVSRVTNDTETIKEFWSVFLRFFDGGFNALSIGIAMFLLSPRLAWVFMGFIPFIFLLIHIFQKYSTLIYGEMREALAILNAKLSESISGMALIQVFNQEERKKKEFDDINQRYVKARTNMFKMDALLLMPAINFLEALALTLVLWIFGGEFLQGKLVDIGVLYAFTSYATAFFSPIGHMLDSLTFYQDGLVSGSRVLRLMEDPRGAPGSLEGAQGEITQGRIEIKNLSFSYDGKNQVLHDINLEVEPGQTVAFVGQTGSGKSSIINVLMRLYDFDKGQILIDGQDIRRLPIEEVRSQMGLVLQESFLFYGNILNNIRLHGDYGEEEVKKAAEFVQADPFIRSLKGGYKAPVIEGGGAFSSGQRQLISFARTILRNPKILILDEATASIDTETEQLIQKGLSRMREGRTTLIIAHRLSTIRDADKIYVLKQGRIVEAGSHDQLMEKEGLYYKMYQLQKMQKLAP
ncbi:MAG: ABC transporter ATP-binding protein [Tissierellia bacterium]|nr:ABC transporter ATP-binding protein [Tissierellia bacterium]